MEETGMTRGREGQGEESQSSWLSIPHLDSDSGPRNAKEGGEAHRSQAGFPSGTERCRVSTHGGLGTGLPHIHSSRRHRSVQFEDESSASAAPPSCSAGTAAG